MSVLSWLLVVFTTPETICKKDFAPLILFQEKILKERGISGLIDFCKSTRLSLLHYLAGEFPKKRISGVRLTKDGIPFRLGPNIIKAIRKKPTCIITIRLVLTILYATRALTAGTKPDISPITGLSSVTDIPFMGKYAVRFWREMGYQSYLAKDKTPKALHFKSYHFSTKTGPNGHALWTAMRDLVLIKEFKTLRSNLEILGGPKFVKYFNLCLDSLEHLPKSLTALKGSETLRRITWFPDKENKVRVIAICDYWSQTVLRPLHDFLYKVLRKIPQDCTFDQGSFKDKVKSWEYYYSFDLSNATDRFPIRVISTLLKAYLPVKYVNAWEYVMVGIPFDYKHGNNLDKVNYSVGNPMGAYSSWATFALTHHYILYWCCTELGKPWKSSKYVLLGDDILIGDHDVAKLYLETMTRLGVEISTVKTHSSSKLYEFAKRLVLNGEEITPFPISSIHESSKKFYLLTTLCIDEQRKGWSWINGIPSTVKKFYTHVLKANSSFATRLKERVILNELMIYTMRGEMTPKIALNTIVDHFKLPLKEIQDYPALSVLSGTALEIFAENNPFDTEGKETLGYLALNLTLSVLNIESSSFGQGSLDDLPQSIPLLNCYGQICEKWMQLSKEAFLIDTIGKGEWPMHLRTLALPNSDRIFSERSHRTISRVGTLLGDRVLQNMRRLRQSDFDY